ncbi:MAG: hypothetical protein ABDH21_00410 [bacterium]
MFKKGITISEILVVLTLSLISLFLIIQSIVSITSTLARQTELINCLSIAKNYIELYSYYPRGSLIEMYKTSDFNIGIARYKVVIEVKNYGYYTSVLGLRKLTVTVFSRNIRNTRAKLTTLI